MDLQQKISKGWHLVRQGQTAAAVKLWLEELKSCDELHGELPYWIALGGYLREARQAERALYMHQHVYHLLENDAYLRCLLQMHLCLDLLALGQSDLAKKSLKGACEFSDLPRCYVLQELLGQIYVALELYEKAAESYELAIRVGQDDAAFVALCSLHLLKVYAQIKDIAPERLSGAIDIAKQHHSLLAAQVRPMLIELGHACQKLGRDIDAASYFKQALAISAPTGIKKAKPRRLSMVEYKLQQITNDIEIEMLREKNAAQHQQVQQLESAGFRNEITGLYNSRYLAMRWDDLYQQASQGATLCLLNIGINLFASISEVLGKELALLTYVQIGQILQSECPDNAILVTSSTGAFELLLIDKEKAEVEQLIAIVQSKIAQIEQVYLPEPLSISTGGAYFELYEARDIFQLRANLALFLAQRKESQQICWDGDE